MIEQTSPSISIGSPPLSVTANVSVPSPLVKSTVGTGVVHFEEVKKYLSNKPLCIRDSDDQKVMEDVSRLAAHWINNRPRGIEIHEMVGYPAYQAIIQIGHRAIRPLLLLLQKKPEHWFYALHAITGQNPVPFESEGNLSEMAKAWVNWGKKRGYIRDLD